MGLESGLNKQAFKQGFVSVLNKSGYQLEDVHDLCMGISKQAWPEDAGLFGAIKDVIWDGPWRGLALGSGAGVAGGLAAAYALSAAEANRLRSKEKTRELDDLLKNQYALQQYVGKKNKNQMPL